MVVFYKHLHELCSLLTKELLFNVNILLPLELRQISKPKLY